MQKNSTKIGSAIFLLLGSLLSVFLVLTAAYTVNLVYLIGDYPELMPLLEGIISGALLFSIAGAFIKGKYRNILYTALVSIAAIVIAYIIIDLYSFVNPDGVIMAAGFLVNSPNMVAVEASNYLANVEKLRTRFLRALLIAVISIFLILFFAIIYEDSGQTILPLGNSIFGYLTLIPLLILLAYSKISKRSKT